VARTADASRRFVAPKQAAEEARHRRQPHQHGLSAAGVPDERARRNPLTGSVDMQPPSRQIDLQVCERLLEVIAARSGLEHSLDARGEIDRESRLGG
jgi:hypothetical protein